jgi:Fur family ferric uptake transcriptional regulator
MANSLNPVPVALTPRQRFDEYLQSRGMRNTQQRRSLLDMVFSEHDHFDADQLIERLPRRGHKGYVSRPTVYRTLAEFVDAGLLRKFDVGGRTVYEHDYGYPQHEHLFCSSCEKLIEFESPALLEIRDHVARDHAFAVRSHRFIIIGTCSQCRANRQRIKRPVDMV